MKFFIGIALGLFWALAGSVLISSLAFKQDTGMHSFFASVPQALVAPVFFLNQGAFADELYYLYQDEAEKADEVFDRKTAHQKANATGSLLSAVVTILFWAPLVAIKCRNRTIRTKPVPQTAVQPASDHPNSHADTKPSANPYDPLDF